MTTTELTPSQHTYRRIGVSKRCCPVCTKLLSLLSAGNKTSSQGPLRVLSGHQNIYPTALSPFVPVEIAEPLIEWLQAMVRSAVAVFVKRWRANPVSEISSTSGDLKGDSPGITSSPGGEEEREEEKDTVEERAGLGWTLEGGRVTFGVWG